MGKSTQIRSEIPDFLWSVNFMLTAVKGSVPGEFMEKLAISPSGLQGTHYFSAFGM